jgi:hypothetical protein
MKKKKSSSDLHQVRPRGEGIPEIRALIHLVRALISGMSLPLGLTLHKNTPTLQSQKPFNQNIKISKNKTLPTMDILAFVAGSNWNLLCICEGQVYESENHM